MIMDGHKYKSVFFDLDGTLTRTRSKTSSSMDRLLQELLKVKNVIIVTGATPERIPYQLGSVAGKIYLLSKNGNHAFVPGGIELWHNALADEEKKEILSYIDRVKQSYDFGAVDEDDIVDDKGCQITYSLIGIHLDIDSKEQFDPDRKIRRKILSEMPFASETLEVSIGGTTSLDFMKKGMNKGYNIRKLIKQKNWDADDCIYIGDDLDERGNDYSVIGVCKTLAVKNPVETEYIIKKLI